MLLKLTGTEFREFPAQAIYMYIMLHLGWPQKIVWSWNWKSVC